MHPQRRALPLRHLGQFLQPRPHGVGLRSRGDGSGMNGAQLGEVGCDAGDELGDRLAATELVDRCVRRRRPVQRGDELPQTLGVARRVDETHVGRHVALEERAHAPEPREPAARNARAHRRRDRDRQGAGELGEPAVLVLDEVGAELPARQPHDEFVTEAEDRVVPPEGQRRQRQIGEIGMLFGEQRPDEIVGDLDLGGGHVLRRHGISPSKPARRSGSRRGTTRGSAAGRRSRTPRSACRSAAASRAAGCASGCAGCTRRA